MYLKSDSQHPSSGCFFIFSLYFVTSALFTASCLPLHLLPLLPPVSLPPPPLPSLLFPSSPSSSPCRVIRRPGVGPRLSRCRGPRHRGREEEEGGGGGGKRRRDEEEEEEGGGGAGPALGAVSGGGEWRHVPVS